MAEGVSMHVTFSVFLFFFFSPLGVPGRKDQADGRENETEKKVSPWLRDIFFFSGTVNLTISLIHCWIE